MQTFIMAQYLPDSESDPEYTERMRKFYKFKKGIEKRYPQVCDQCRPKVEAALNQAGYKAKADHLRRMMDRSRVQRTRQRTWLDNVNTVGRLLWTFGLAFQVLWHLAVITRAVEEPVGLLDGKEEPPEFLLPLASVAHLLPNPETLRCYSVSASMASLWWNPQFVSTFRGFTRHLKGLGTWYAYQAIIIGARLVFLQLADIEGIGNFSRLVSLHAGVIFLTLYVSLPCQRRSGQHVHTNGWDRSTTWQDVP